MHPISTVASVITLSLGMVAWGGGNATAQDLDASTLLATLDGQVTIALDAAGPEAIQGEAVLRSAGQLTEVVIELSGAPADIALWGYLVAGACSDEGEVVAELGEVEIDPAGNGQLAAEVPMALESIANAAISVEVTEPTNEALACGEHVPADR